MPSPETTAIVRNDLGAIAWEYAMDEISRGYVGLSILPIFGTPKKAGVYPIITTESFLKEQKTKRAPRAAYNRSDYTFKEGNFACQEYGFEDLLDDSERELYGQADIDSETIAVMRVMDIVLRAQEQRIITKCTDTATLPNSAASIKWDLPATATPRKDIMDRLQLMRTVYGIRANLMVISEKAKNDLLVCDEITDALKYTNPIELGGVDAQIRILAQYFGIEELRIADAQKDTGKKGQSKTLANIWDDTKCGLYARSDSRDLRRPSIGRSFLWEADSPENILIEQYRAETNRSDVFRARQSVGENFMFTGAAFILTGIS